MPKQPEARTTKLTDKPHYLSIDIDYWTALTHTHGLDVHRMIYEVGKLLEERPKRLPITAVMNHQQLLWNVNRTRARRLINVDYHSDINPSTVDTLHCGSWVSYVTWRFNGEYIWVRPKKDPSVGSCSQDVYWSRGTDWNVATSAIIHPDTLNLKELLCNCRGVGLCMSPAYIPKTFELAFMELIKQFNIPYRDGDRLELRGEPRRPPGIRPPPGEKPLSEREKREWVKRHYLTL